MNLYIIIYTWIWMDRRREFHWLFSWRTCERLEVSEHTHRSGKVWSRPSISKAWGVDNLAVQNPGHDCRAPCPNPWGLPNKLTYCDSCGSLLTPWGSVTCAGMTAKVCDAACEAVTPKMLMISCSAETGCATRPCCAQMVLWTPTSRQDGTVPKTKDSRYKMTQA